MSQAAEIAEIWDQAHSLLHEGNIRGFFNKVKVLHDELRTADLQAISLVEELGSRTISEKAAAYLRQMSTILSEYGRQTSTLEDSQVETTFASSMQVLVGTFMDCKLKRNQRLKSQHTSEISRYDMAAQVMYYIRDIAEPDSKVAGVNTKQLMLDKLIRIQLSKSQPEKEPDSELETIYSSKELLVTDFLDDILKDIQQSKDTKSKQDKTLKGRLKGALKKAGRSFKVYRSRSIEQRNIALGALEEAAKLLQTGINELATDGKCADNLFEDINSKLETFDNNSTFRNKKGNRLRGQLSAISDSFRSVVSEVAQHNEIQQGFAAETNVRQTL